MIHRPALLADLQRELVPLQRDILARAEQQPALAGELRAEYDEAFHLGRTASSYDPWLDEQVTQAAVAWLLGCVFLRFCEDNRLIRPVWLAGPPDRRGEAVDAHHRFYQEHPDRTDREWLVEAFCHLQELPATAAVFAPRNPLWRLQPSGDGAERLVSFWRRVDESGALVHDFSDSEMDTRFLGDLYQDLSPEARDRYALFQTPEFVEEFILDRTLQRALQERGPNGLKLMDPACGSGHFLLGAFRRLLDRWHREAPGMDARERVQRALDAIHGVDINPFAVAIAEFRLTVAALRASGEADLEHAPAYRYHLAVGDSLLHGTRQLTLDEASGAVQDADAALSGFTYAAEDFEELRKLLVPGQYDVVVANPPYMTVKDQALNRVYRRRYQTCSGTYALTVPFCERLFELAGEGGWVGQIASNSFMRREFGKKLIEQFLVRKDLVEVIDTSGAYIPGHGTPTVILICRNRSPIAQIRAILGIRGEPETPADPAQGLVWTDILQSIDLPGVETEYVTVADLPKSALGKHPWSLVGGGAGPVKQQIDAVGTKLGSVVERPIGRAVRAGADDVFVRPWRYVAIAEQEASFRPFVTGDAVRDWGFSGGERILYPYNSKGAVATTANTREALIRLLWPWRTSLASRATFSGNMHDAGLEWWEYMQHTRSAYARPLSITFAFVATHNHFVLDRGGKVFNKSAPVIKLPDGATEEEHLRLLGLLNSSTACFWLKQVSHDKGSQGINEGFKSQAWERFYEFTGTKLEQFPLPAERPLEPARRLDRLAQDALTATATAVAAAATPNREALDSARSRWERIRAEMIALQEELDWHVYRLYGLLDEDLTYHGDGLPDLALGERAFEIVLARRVRDGEEQTAWFERHSSPPITEVPAHLPAAYRELVERRIALIAERPDLALIERPEHKRRWATEPWAQRERAALRDWVLDRMEQPQLWRDPQGRPQVRSVRQLADALAGDDDLVAVLGLYTGSRDYDLTSELERLLAEESVPFVAAHRYRESGLRKRATWEEVWALQRREDAGEGVGKIPVPPKYAQADFARQTSWHHRGKLDVPKERFVSYPAAERDGDRSPVYGWAGWDHLEQALALAGLLLDRRREDGWPAERLTPLVAGLVELEPWLHQWHGAPDPTFGGPPCNFLSAQIDVELGEQALTREQVRAWRPQNTGRGRRRAPRQAPEPQEVDA